MNKTLSISLAGFSFMVEEHAYIKISDYLKALRSTLDASEADEVMHDIEIRMVEIFREIMGKREVINDDDAEYVINKIGRPEQIEEQEDAYFSEKTNFKNSYGKDADKTLLRDPLNKKLGGVCAGLAHYFGMQITWMRLIWLGVLLLLFFGHSKAFFFVIFSYLVLWVVVPVAKSASDFLRMKGEPLNFDNLKQESNKLYQFTADAVQKTGDAYNRSIPQIRDSGEKAWDVLRVILGGFLGLIGLSLLAISVAILGAGWIDVSKIHLPGNWQFLFLEGNLQYVLVGFGFLSAFIPALIFIFLAVKLIWQKTKLRNTMYLIGALMLIWIGLGAFMFATGETFSSKYRGKKTDESTVAIASASDSILVDLKKVEIPRNFANISEDFYTDKKTIYEQDYPILDVTRKDGNFAPYLLVRRFADGYNIPINFTAPVEITGNKISLPNYIYYPYSDRLRDSRVEYELVVPKNKKVIKMNGERGYQVNDDADEDDNDGDSASVKTNGNSIIINSPNGDSVTVNGKKISGKAADKIMEKTLENGNVDLKIKNGKKEIVIKTK